MNSAFDEQIAPFRRELLAHCYRLTGSLTDAEDALQDSLVRAWRGLPAFEGRASLRTWLYRVTTNRCLDLIADRRGRTLPTLVGPSGTVDDDPPPDLEPTWLEAFPDALIEDDPASRPDEVYARREATRLAFVAALQRLPPRQRAMLILRDVVALSAEEAAAALDVSVATGTSLLQRARATLEEQPRRKVAPTTPAALADLLARYVRAWEGGDAGALIALLCHDAITSMPPSPLWLAGRDTIVDYMVQRVWPRGALRLVPAHANDAPSFAVYRRGDDGFALVSLTVLEIDGGAVSAFHSFLAFDPRFAPARYGLAPTLSST